MSSDELGLLSNNDLITKYDKIRTIVKNVRIDFRNDSRFIPNQIDADTERYGFSIRSKKGELLLWVGIFEPLWKEEGCALTVLAQQGEHLKFYRILENRDSQQFEGYRFVPFEPHDSDVVREFHSFILKNLRSIAETEG